MKTVYSLTLRERLLVMGGGALLLVLGAWLYVWQPIVQMQTTQTDRIARYLTVLDLSDGMGGSAPQIAVSPTPATPLAQRITQSGEAAGIALARLDPDGPRLRVTVAEASYASLIGWIASLEAESGVRMLSVEMSRLTGPGTVSLRMSVEDAR